MEYRQLGRSGLQVSAIGLGTNTFGDMMKRAVSPEEAAAIVDRALSLGVNFIDTADVYSRGKSEDYIGRAIAGRRRDVIIGTKFRSPMGQGPNQQGASRGYLFKAVEDSLRRLDTDYIDVYQVHRPDSTTPIEETMRALDDLVRSGKVRYVGTSNFPGWQLVEAQWVAKSEHLTPIISEQPQYNLMARGVEAEVIPACLRYGIGLIPWGPLAGGFLSGKYHRGEPPPSGTRLGGSPMAQRVLNDRNFDFVECLQSFAAERGHNVRELAVAWLLSRPVVSTVIIGATNPDQVDENVQAAEWKLTEEDLKAIDEIKRP